MWETREMICYVLAMGKQHLWLHVVVGYGIKIFWPGLFITSPDHLEWINSATLYAECMYIAWCNVCFCRILFQGSFHFLKVWLKFIKRYTLEFVSCLSNKLYFVYCKTLPVGLDFDSFVSQVKHYIKSCLKFNENLNVRYYCVYFL